MHKKHSVLLVGAGAMGGALLSGWLRHELLDIKRSAVVDPGPSPAICTAIDVAGLTLNPAEDQGYEVCVLAVKPQNFSSIIPTLYWPGIEKTAFISIAAGQSLTTIRTLLMPTGAQHAPIIRAMPNLPVCVGMGATVLFADSCVTDSVRMIAHQLMASVGQAFWLENEDAIDMATAISGSGPAYVFLLAECMAQAGQELGLPPSLATALARQTVIGGGTLLGHDERDMAALREAVTSPGGTTAAALDVLQGKDGMRTLLQKAAHAALHRARALQ